MLDGLPEMTIPRESDQYIPLADLLFDGEPTITVDVGYAKVGTRPVTNFAPLPGPKAPVLPGRYLVEVRQSGVVAKIGYLVVD